MIPLETLTADGVTLARAADGTLRVNGDREAVARWLPTIREHRDELLAAITPEPADPLADGWRRQLATDTWHRDWSAVWKRGSATVTANQLPFAVADLVNAWNVCTGDRRTVAEYLKHLSPVDHDDQEIMCRGWLALYTWTLFHREAQP